jgi:CheY-like chemotaxis protein
VRLPWNEPAAGAPAQIRPADRTRTALDGVRVLLVEDDASTREAMERMLVRAGAAIVAVATGADALAALASADPPDVIVSDLGLPGMSGYELIERVVKDHERRMRPPPPSCAVSAHAREVDRQRAIEAGFDMYLAKPVTAERLIEAVADLRDVLASKRD